MKKEDVNRRRKVYPHSPFSILLTNSPLSFTGKRWILADRRFGADLPDVLAQERMIHRGPMAEQVRLSDPMLFPEMGRALDRIRSAIARRERIGIFGDYDADGITGCVQLTRAFRRRGIDPVVYLPHREEEGYGLKTTSIDSLLEQGVTLLLTVDTGISAREEIVHAHHKGMDIIITDHHVAHDGRPPAYAVLHPKIPSEFPNAHLTGSGVALMLVRALEQADGIEVWQGLEEDLALAAIGTIADMGALKGENRTLVMYGLQSARRLPMTSALKMLIDQARIDAAMMTSTDVGFRIAPRINASGRMADPRTAFDALMGDRAALKQLETYNEERQKVTRELYEEIQTTVDDAFFLCRASTKFPAGIVGLLAGKLSEEFGRPSLVGSLRNGICTASLRSVPGIHLPELLHDERLRPHLLRFGGHSQAAGCTMKEDSFPMVKTLLNTMLVERGITHELLVPQMRLDGAVTPEFLTPAFVKELQTLEPFGEGNPEPLFLLSAAELSMMRCVGHDGSHLSCSVFGKKAIAFRMGHLLEHVQNKQIDLACKLSLQTWNGREELQVTIEDMRKCS